MLKEAGMNFIHLTNTSHAHRNFDSICKQKDFDALLSEGIYYCIRTIRQIKSQTEPLLADFSFSFFVIR